MLMLANKKERQWLVFVICQDPANSSGACHRSRQLLEILEVAGWNLQPVADPTPPPSRWATLGAGLDAASRHGPLLPFGIESLRSQGHGGLAVAELLKRYPSLEGVIIEGTGYGALASVAIWKAHGRRTVMVPANIESLAPNTGTWTHRRRDVARRFADERPWWAMADAIFTISPEESWWLQLHGITAEPLPYHPPSDVRRRLEAIRQNRQPDTEFGYLWLADFRNPANQEGLSRMLEVLREYGAPPHPIQVVGIGSDKLRERFDLGQNQSIHIRGEVSDMELQRCHELCLAQLIVHPPSSGMLTRVVDAAFAGIPIVGNSMALKSYQHLFMDNLLIEGSWPTYPRAIGAPQRPRQAEASLHAVMAGDLLQP
jgi:hypothetical protein